MDKAYMHFKPVYLAPRHALIPKKCKFCHQDMEIKQINSTEALRMCFKCSIPLQQLESDAIEFFHRAYRDMLKSPLEWNTNVSNEDDDLSNLPLWIEQMELKVSKYDSDDETSENCVDYTQHQKLVCHTPSTQDSSYDWQSEAFKELEAALEKASNEQSQSNNLPFSFDDFFLPGNQMTEQSVRTSNLSGVGCMEEVQETSLNEFTGEISQVIVNHQGENDSWQSQMGAIHDNFHSDECLEPSAILLDTDQLPQVNTDKNSEVTNFEPSKNTNEIEKSSDTEENNTTTVCSVNTSVMQLNDSVNVSEMQHAISGCLEIETESQGETVQQINLSNISEMDIYEKNATDLHASESHHLEILSESQACNEPFMASGKLYETVVEKKETSKDVIEITHDIKSIELDTCEKMPNSEKSERLHYSEEAIVDGKRSVESCVVMQTAALANFSHALVKDRDHNNSSDCDSFASSINQISPSDITPITADQNGSENKSLSQPDQIHDKFDSPISETILQLSVSQIDDESNQSTESVQSTESNQSTVVISNKCGTSLPVSLWSKLSQYLIGNNLVYEHVCDCDEEQVQLSPANNDGEENQCIDLPLPDLSLSSLIEEDIRKPNMEAHTLDKLLFSPLNRSCKKKYSVKETARKLDLNGTSFGEITEDYNAVPIFIATVPADSDITQDMLHSLPLENLPFVFEDSSVDIKPFYQNVTSCEKTLQSCSNRTSSDISSEGTFISTVIENRLENNDSVPQNILIPGAAVSEGKICSSSNSGHSPSGMTLNIDDCNIKINFFPDIKESPSDASVCHDDAVQGIVDAPLQNVDEICFSTAVDNEYSDIESYSSSSHCGTSSYSQFSEGIDQTCSSSITAKKVRDLHLDEKSFSMMIDRPLQLHGITVEEDDDELKCFSGSKFKPIGNRKPSLKEGKIESEPRMLNLLNSVRREVKMAKQPKVRKS